MNSTYRIVHGNLASELNDLARDYDIEPVAIIDIHHMLVHLTPRVPVRVEKRAVAFIAAPYAAPDREGETLNIWRAEALGKLAAAMGYTPIVVHSFGRGVFGDDTNPSARGLALECSLALVRYIASIPRSRIFVLANDDGMLTNGVGEEVSAWLMTGDAEGVMSHTWGEWAVRFRAAGLSDLWRGFADL